MTKEHFLELFKKTGKYDVNDLNGALRRCDDGCCPILAVYRDNYLFGEEPMKHSNEDAYFIGRRVLGLQDFVVDDIIGGADNSFCVSDVAMRAELLTTIGLIQEREARASDD